MCRGVVLAPDISLNTIARTHWQQAANPNANPEP